MVDGEHQLIHRAVGGWLESAGRRELSEWTNPKLPEQILPASFVVALIKFTAKTGQVTVDEFESAVGYTYYGLYSLAGAMAVRAKWLLESKGMPERLITAVDNSFPDKSAKDFAKTARRRLNTKRKLLGYNAF